jgi:hypothetical protein
MFDILTIIPGKRKTTAKGWVSFNSPCCHYRGHKPDKRMRGGLIKDNYNFTYSCFNCHFKCRFELGKPLSANTKLFLKWCGADEGLITKILKE